MAQTVAPCVVVGEARTAFAVAAPALAAYTGVVEAAHHTAVALAVAAHRDYPMPALDWGYSFVALAQKIAPSLASAIQFLG